MSTTFGIKVSSQEYPIEVAFRSREIYFTNPLAELMPDDTEVIAMDNEPQDIYTIGDIKKEIKGQQQKSS